MRNKYNLGHQYTDRYITEPYYSIDFMDEGLDLNSKTFESDPDLIEWDREFAEYLDRLKDENTTKRDK